MYLPWSHASWSPETSKRISHLAHTSRRNGGIKTERARRTMRAVSEMWCVFVNTRLRRFHAVAVSCCGGMLHLWSCVLGTCVGGRPRVAHTMDTTISFLLHALRSGSQTRPRSAPSLPPSLSARPGRHPQAARKL